VRSAIRRRLVVAVASVVLVAACAGARPSEALSPPVASPSAPVAAAASPITGASPSPSPSGQPVPFALNNPRIAGTLPPGWREVPIEDFRRQIVEFAKAYPEAAEATARQLREIDVGELRLVIQGKSGPSIDTITVSIRTDRRPTAMVVEAETAAVLELAPGATIVRTTKRQIAIGPLTRIEVLGPATTKAPRHAGSTT
jgi:hypothetical protein